MAHGEGTQGNDHRVVTTKSGQLPRLLARYLLPTVLILITLVFWVSMQNIVVRQVLVYLVFFTLFSVPVILVIINRVGKNQTARMPAYSFADGTSFQTKSLDPDSAILEFVRHLSNRFGIKWNPALVWSDRYDSPYATSGSPIAYIPSDHPFIRDNELFLAASVKGKLKTEEWTPLIASSFIYYIVLKNKKTLGVLARVGSIILVDVAVFLILWAVVGPPARAMGPYTLFLILSSVISSLAGFFAFVRYLRLVWLLADRITCQLVDADLFVDVLNRIRSFHITELTEGGLIMSKPSLDERVQNLRKLTSVKSPS